MSTKYRPEIDGLRALAIVPVLLFHAGMPGLSGGFLGVDVFFVISGFLITSLLADDFANRRFSIVTFYERRARRLMPALLAVCLVSSVAAIALLPPMFLRSYGHSLVASSTFASNIYFFLTSDYFDNRSEEKPLLHTWSLAVEEQFYILFPLVLWLLWRVRPSFRIIWMVGAAVASLMAASALAPKNPMAVFYLLPFRAWELLAGCSLALWMQGRQSEHDDRWMAVGLGMIVGAYILLGANSPLPPAFMLLPVLGTTLVIRYSGGTLSKLLLTNRTMVWLGLISYPLYLWHWPIIALVHARSVGPQPELIAGAVLLSIALAHGTWKYIEAPVRQSRLWPGRTVLLVAGSSFLGLATLGAALHVSAGWPGRYGYTSAHIERDRSPMRERCHSSDQSFISPDKACRYFLEPARWAVVGNSHGVELAYALAQKVRSQNTGVEPLSRS